MKKVITGKLYDTDTAQKAGHWNNGRYGNDFEACSETLYRKRTGEYFLHGEGGALSRYGEWHGNSGGSGEKIMPLTLADAREWAEQHLDGDEYIAIFGEPDEGDGTKVTLNITVPTDVKATLERMRAETGKSISQLVADMVTGV